jgi:acyl dehydratase
MHVDPVAAEAGYFGTLIASGIHTFGIWQRLAVLNIFPGWQIIAGRGVQLEFPAPVRAGATLSGVLEVAGVEPVSATRSLISKHARMHDDTGVLVFEMRAEVFMRRRPA